MSRLLCRLRRALVASGRLTCASRAFNCKGSCSRPTGCDIVIGCWLLSGFLSARLKRSLGVSALSGEVIYQHDDETAVALVETMRHLAGKARFRSSRMNCRERKEPQKRVLTSQDGFCLMAYEFRDGLMQAYGPTARCGIDLRSFRIGPCRLQLFLSLASCC